MNNSAYTLEQTLEPSDIFKIAQWFNYKLVLDESFEQSELYKHIKLLVGREASYDDLKTVYFPNIFEAVSSNLTITEYYKKYHNDTNHNDTNHNDTNHNKLSNDVLKLYLSTIIRIPRNVLKQRYKNILSDDDIRYMCRYGNSIVELTEDKMILDSVYSFRFESNSNINYLSILEILLHETNLRIKKHNIYIKFDNHIDYLKGRRKLNILPIKYYKGSYNDKKITRRSEVFNLL